MFHVVLAVASASPERAITFNQRPATAAELAVLARYEQAWSFTTPTGAYWYDDRTGAVGLWGGPTRGFLAPGLGLGGGAVPANASGGGDGRLGGVFVNGRELHPLDVQGLAGWIGQAPSPGRWWVDASGAFGLEGSGPVGNLFVLASSRPGSSYYRSDLQSGSSTFVGSGCAAVSARLSPSDADSSYSYYVGCE